MLTQVYWLSLDIKKRVAERFLSVLHFLAVVHQVVIDFLQPSNRNVLDHQLRLCKSSLLEHFLNLFARLVEHGLVVVNRVHLVDYDDHAPYVERQHHRQLLSQLFLHALELRRVNDKNTCVWLHGRQ